MWLRDTLRLQTGPLQQWVAGLVPRASRAVTAVLVDVAWAGAAAVKGIPSLPSCSALLATPTVTGHHAEQGKGTHPAPHLRAGSKEGDGSKQGTGRVESPLLSWGCVHGGFKWACNPIPAIGRKDCEGAWGRGPQGIAWMRSNILWC